MSELEKILKKGIHARTIPEVIERMEEIEKLLSDDDGLKAFNFLYKKVTEAIHRDAKKHRWKNKEWMIHLDVDFAKLYFKGILACIEKDKEAPKVWQLLMDNRFKEGLSPVQFALIGVNAHINRDLMLAVVSSHEKIFSSPCNETREHFDYFRVNEILDKIEVGAMKTLATGYIKKISNFIEPWDRKLAMTFIHTCRELAWNNAMHLWEIKDDSQKPKAFVKKVDSLSATMGQVFLLRTE